MILCAAGMAALSGPDTDSAKSHKHTTLEAPSVANDDTVGSIVGKVVWEGDRPAAKPELSIKESETDGCEHGGSGVATDDRSLVISKEGGVANVVMMIEATDIVVPEEAINIDQKGCRFDPRVVVVPVGATLTFNNSDTTNHNIHTFAKKNQPMNKNVAGGQSMGQMLDKAEVINVTCDIHNWMKSFVVVTDASHTDVSGADGSFKLEGLPAGEYKIEWWHEELGKGKTELVKVEAGKVTEYTHKVGATKKKKKGGRRR